MEGKGLNLIDKCAGCVCSSWGDSKMCTPDTIVKSYRTSTKINKTGAVSKAKILVGKVTL